MKFDELLTCKIDNLQEVAEKISLTIEKEDVETFIRTIWERVPELTEEQEKKIHKFGRTVLKKFNMKRIKE